MWAVLTLALLGAYHVLRYAAAQCNGGGCDAYIPLSLIIPLLTWASGVVTGVKASLSAAGSTTAWRLALIVATLLGGVGPMLSVLVLRDSPDVIVPIATALLAITPVAALLYALAHSSMAEG